MILFSQTEPTTLDLIPYTSDSKRDVEPAPRAGPHNILHEKDSPSAAQNEQRTTRVRSLGSNHLSNWLIKISDYCKKQRKQNKKCKLSKYGQE